MKKLDKIGQKGPFYKLDERYQDLASGRLSFKGRRKSRLEKLDAIFSGDEYQHPHLANSVLYFLSFSRYNQRLTN